MTDLNTSVIEHTGEQGKSFVELLNQAAIGNDFQLKSLEFDGGYSVPLELYPSDRFGRHLYYSQLLYSALEKIPFVKQLKMTGGKKINFKNLLASCPKTLEYLELTSAEGCWGDDMDFTKLQKLKCLKLAYTGLNDISKMSFPGSLEVLDLSDNQIASVENVVFSKNLVSLNLSNNMLHDIRRPHLPATLKLLNVTGNKLDSIDLQNGLETLYVAGLWDLRLSRHDIDLSCCKIPNLLQGILLNYFKVPASAQFSLNLVSLRLEYCELSEGMSLDHLSNLKFLYVTGHDIESFEIKLPQSLEDVEVDLDQLREFPRLVCMLKNIRRLRVMGHIKWVNAKFESRHLEILDLSLNYIDDLELRFPEGVTNLKLLNLATNYLDRLTMNNIGHTKTTKHENLYELDISNNKLSSDKVRRLVSTLPSATKCLRTSKKIRANKLFIDYIKMDEYSDFF